MEYIEWVAQLKSLAINNLTTIQRATVSLNLVIVMGYFCVTLLKLTSIRVAFLLAILLSMVVTYTPIYNHLDQVQYHAIFAIIYTPLTYLVKLKKTKVACCMLGSFQTIMAWDSWANANTETFIWTNYEVIVCLLHALIIGSFLERDVERIKSILDCFITGLRNLFGYTCNQLRLWYYYTNAQIKTETKRL